MELEFDFDVTNGWDVGDRFILLHWHHHDLKYLIALVQNISHRQVACRKGQEAFAILVIDHIYQFEFHHVISRDIF